MGDIDEGALGGVPEELSEKAKAGFAAAAAGMAQIRKEEKKSKKKDDQVAKVIIQFLGDERFSHLFLLISRLVSRDTPSIFILALLSLIDERSREVVQEYLKENLEKTEKETIPADMALTKTGELDPKMSQALVEWITRMQMVLSLSPEKILTKLMIDEKNIDGTVLQLATFILQHFFQTHKKVITYEHLQPLAASIMQTVFQPFMKLVRKRVLQESKDAEDAKDAEEA